jgi:hypothetical protein
MVCHPVCSTFGRDVHRTRLQVSWRKLKPERHRLLAPDSAEKALTDSIKKEMLVIRLDAKLNSARSRTATELCKKSVPLPDPGWSTTSNNRSRKSGLPAGGVSNSDLDRGSCPALVVLSRDVLDRLARQGRASATDIAILRQPLVIEEVEPSLIALRPCPYNHI